MAFAEGVVDLDHNRTQRAVGRMAVPKAHRFEGVAEHARIGVQPDFPRRIFHPFAAQELVKPGHGIVTTITVVTVMKAEQPAAVVRQRMRLAVLHGAHGQH